eukprot:TRINITY_DN16324_c0_g1_i2.p1 TRINITY_DN16324_c0_g1~~TRINITY_DN16324_c0_g1_i2.p1  ORF type:complete len:414 (+),score=96.75 TRINITY_DN16324_c0_g1_i2:84-1244(+)
MPAPPRSPEHRAPSLDGVASAPRRRRLSRSSSSKSEARDGCRVCGRPPGVAPGDDDAIAAAEQFVTGAVRVLGLSRLDEAVLEAIHASGARAVVSVGSGLGIAEGALRLPPGVTMVTVDPEPESFNGHPCCGVRCVPPTYATAADLAAAPVWPTLQRVGVLLLLLWPLGGDGAGYDIDAVRILAPRAVVGVYYESGGSGSADFLAWVSSVRGGASAAQGGAAPADPLCGWAGLREIRVRACCRAVSPAALEEAARLSVPPEHCAAGLGAQWAEGSCVLAALGAGAPLAAAAAAAGADVAGWSVSHAGGERVRDGAEVDAAAAAAAAAGRSLELVLSPYSRRFRGTLCVCFSALRAAALPHAAPSVWLEDRLGSRRVADPPPPPPPG